LSLLVICSCSIISCKKEILIPKRVNIKSITILNFPESNSSGNSWDGSLQGSYPDVYFKIKDINGNILYTHPSDLRFENLRKSALPKTWSSSTSFASFNNLEQGFSVTLTDFESLASDEFMGGVQTNTTFKSLVADGDLPKETTISFGEYSFKVGLEWVF
jgi:hypothetical protein